MIGQILGNRYEILEKIGSGGMADVYKAHCRFLDRFVAVKVLKKDFTQDEAFIEKFKKESLAVAKLSHHTIVNIYDVGEDEDIYYIIMELIEGKTLKKCIKEKKFFLENEVIDISLQIAEALKHAHANNIVHRDIKPQNIMINDEGKIKVTDFGIARTASQNTVQCEKEMMGSVHYSSPEQAKGRLTDEKSDLYSLGIVMYEMATGILPFEGESPITVAYKQIKEAVNFPEKLDNNISNGLRNVILKAVQKDQSLRYQSAIEIISDLNKLKYNSDFKTEFKDLNESPTMIIPKVNIVEKEDDTDETMFQTQKIVIGKENNINFNEDAFEYAFESEVEDMKKIKKKSKKSNSRVLSAILSVIAILLALAVVLFFSIRYFNDNLKVKEIEVPNVIEMEYNKAEELLLEKGIQMVIDAEIYDVDNEKGIILDQNPKEGMHIKSGSVRVVLSKGAEMVFIPNLSGSTTNETRVTLEELGLKLGEVERVYSDKEIGEVVNQAPESGVEVVKGTKIDILISKGKEKKYYKMPNIIGLSRSRAEADIISAGFIVGEISEDYSQNIAIGLVSEQGFRAQTEVTEGSEVDFVISKGPKPITDGNQNDINQSNANSGNGDSENSNDMEINSQNNQEGEQTQLIERELLLRLPEGEGTVLVSVKKVTGDSEEVVYEKTHNKEEQGIRVIVKDSGTVKYKIYFDNQYGNDYEVVF